MKILFVGKFNQYPWGEIPTERLLGSAISNYCEVKELDIDSSGIVRQIIEEGKAVDLVLFSSATLDLSLKDLGIIRKVLLIPLVLYTNDWIFLNKARAEIYLDRFWAFNALITTDSVDYSEYGVKQFYRIPMACLPSYKFKPSSLKSLVFVGASHYLKERREFLEKIRNCFPSSLDVYGYGGNKSPVYEKKLEEVIQGYKIVLGHNCTNSRGYWSSRNYIIPGYGGFLLTPYVKGLGKEFKNKKHIIWYKDFDECVNLIRYYLVHDEEREKIRKQGYEFTQKVHNWSNRSKDFLRIFNKMGVK